MSESAPPRFATRWDFLFGRVVIGFDPAERRLFTVASQSGDALLAMWTDADVARAALPAAFRPVQTDVAGRLVELPDGVGVAVDPDRPGAMVVEPGYAARLKPLTAPFPAGTSSEVKQWPLLPAGLRRALAAAAERYRFVDAVWALTYTIDDSPWIGLLVYRTAGGQEAQESVVDALDAALSATATGPEELGVPLVRIVAHSDLAPELREALADQPTVFSR